MIGKTIGNYLVLELIGEGGMGTVYRAQDRMLGREVAIKVLHPQLLKNELFLTRFKNEAMLSARINHPNVTTLFQLLEHDGCEYIVMEFIDGENLEELLKRQGTISFEKVVSILIQLVEGLKHAHSKGIIHRDIKPGNVMINSQGYLKLMDFGIARLAESRRLTKLNHVIGTNGYLAPELLDGVAPSISSDLFAVGVLSYELLYGKLPIIDASNSLSLRGAMGNQVSFPLFSNGGNCPGLIRIVRKLLRKNPDKRYQSSDDLLRDLEGLGSERRLSNINSADSLIRTGINTQLIHVIEQAGLWMRKGQVLIGQLKLPKVIYTIEGKIIVASLCAAVVILVASFFWPNQKKGGETASLIGQDTSHFVLTSNPMMPEPHPLNFSDKDEKGSVVEVEEGKEKDEAEEVDSAVVVGGGRERKIEQESAPIIEREKPKAVETEAQEPAAVDLVSERDQENFEKKELEPENAELKIIETPLEKQVAVKSKMIDAIMPEIEISAAFSSSVSSNEATANEIIYLENQSEIRVQGNVVIARGARIKAVVKDAVSSKQKARAFLAIQIVEVETVDGQWTPLVYPVYSDRGSREIVFEEGMTLRKLKLKSNRINIRVAL